MIESLMNSTVFEKAINSALQFDPQAADKLQMIEGKRISINLEGWSGSCCFIVNSGRLQVSDQDAQPADVYLRGNLGGFLKLFKSSEQSQSNNANQKLYIEGDLHAAQAFQQVMKSLKPDFQAVLTDKFGADLAGIISKVLVQVQNGSLQAKSKIDDAVYKMIKQSNFFVSYADFDQVQTRINALNANIQRLEATIKDLG